MKPHQILVFFILSFVSARAQPIDNLYAIKGSVKTSSGEALANANVILYHSKDTSLVKSTISDNSGNYVFTNLEPSSYLIKVTFSATNRYQSPILTLTKEDMLHPIVIAENPTQLNTVVINGSLPMIEQQLGKVTLNVANTPSSAGSSAFEILEKAPGITVDQQGTISMRGRQGVVVMINGKPIQMSGAELAEMLRGTAGSQIQKIELIQNPSAKYDAAGSAGIIDIKMKKQATAGLNGNLALSTGYGAHFKSNNGGNINFRKGKLNLFGNYNLAYRGDYVKMDIERNYYGEQLPYAGFIQDFDQKIKFKSHTSRMGADYSLTDKTVIGTELFGNFIDIDRKTASINRFIRADQAVLNFENTLSDVRNGRTNYGANINLSHQLDSTGTAFNLDIDYGRFLLDDIQDYDIRYLNLHQQESKNPYLLYNDANGDLNIKAMSLNFNKKLLKTVDFETGLKLSSTNSRTQLDFYNRSTGEDILDPELSNLFNYKETVQSAYINFSKKTERFNLQVGLRAENTRISGTSLTATDGFSKDYLQFFPSAAILYHINTNHAIGASLSRRITRPSYNQLNPFFYFLDLSTRFSGNSNLNPSLSYAMQLNYTFKGRYLLSLSYFNANNPIVDVQIKDQHHANALIQIPFNLGQQTDYSFTLTAPVRIANWFSTNNNLGLNYSIFKGAVQSEAIYTKKSYLYLNSNNSFKIKDWTLQLIGTYNGSRYFGNTKVDPVAYLSLAVQRKFTERTTLSFNLGDVFHSNTINSQNSLSSYSNNSNWRRDSRFGTFSLNYRFGGKETQSKRKTGAAEEEKRRAQ